VAAGLGIATKVSGVVLVPCVAIALLIVFRDLAEGAWLARLWRRVRPALPWGLLALATVFANLAGAVGEPRGYVAPDDAGRRRAGHESPRFLEFLLHQIRPDPAAAFIPWPGAFRTTPWVMLG
jgi:hypothetical protein